MTTPPRSQLNLTFVLLAIFSATLLRVTAQPIPAYEATALDTRQEGKPGVTVRISDPIIVAVASKPEPWGYFQFPGITRRPDGTVAVEMEYEDRFRDDVRQTGFGLFDLRG